MNAPVRDETPAAAPIERETERDEDTGFLPWLALVILLACWLAEASL